MSAAPGQGGWTGAQFSALRVLLALAIVWSGLEQWEIGSGRPLLLLVLAAAFGLGWRARPTGVLLAAAAWLLGGDAFLRGTASLAALIGLPDVAPYGAWDRRGRADPGADWGLPAWIPAAAWVGLSGLYLWVGPSVWVALAFAISGLWERSRPWGWLAMLIALAASEDARLWIVPHWVAFNPAWIPARGAAGPDHVFYDGSCALCHSTVRFLIAEDARGERFRFAPLDSQQVRESLDERTRSELPDSVVVRTVDGRLLTRSDGVLRLLDRLGGLWRALAGVGRWVPRPARDAAYDAIARTRYRVFGRRDEACPLLPAELRQRFDP